MCLLWEISGCLFVCTCTCDKKGEMVSSRLFEGGETCALLSLVESPAGLAHYWEERVVKAGVGWLMGGFDFSWQGS